MIKEYKEKHIEDGRYTVYDEKKSISSWGWTDYSVSPYAIFSHRKTLYTYLNFTEKLHTHDFYELVIYVGGAVEYTNEDHLFTPKKSTLSVIINRPGEAHTTRLLREGEYERYVLYFDREFLTFFDSYLPCIELLDSDSGFALTFEADTCERILAHLKHCEDFLLNDNTLSLQNAYISILSLFSALSSDISETEIGYIPENILKIKSYVDRHCCEIKSVNMIAEKFFYSREHVSRLFKKYFNVNLADYLSRQKCERSKEMLLSGEKVGLVCYKCGFGSMPSYVRAFKEFYRMTPAEFARSKRI